MTSPEPLSPRARALLDAARDELGPDAAAMARMRARVLGGAAGGAGVAASIKVATGMSFGAKAAVVVLAVGALGGGAWWLVRAPRPTASAPAVAAGVPPVAAPSAPAPAVAAPLAERPAPAAVPDRGAPAVAVPTPTPAPRRPPASPVTRPARSTLAAEVALVDDAMAALRRDDAAAALAAADDHVARFGRRGQLAEEATAIRVEALCRLGDGRWSAALDAFDARFPRSAQRPRIAAACKGVQ